MDDMIKELESKMEKTLSVLKEDLGTVRAGRANPAILDKVVADYYGTPTPVKNMANIAVPDPRQLLITPFDPSSISTIEHAINESNLGFNPSNDGKSIRLVIPQLTEERRAELIKQVRKYAETGKTATKEDAIEAFKNAVAEAYPELKVD